MKPLVTIGMPVYNAAGTLDRALQSLLRQDYEEFELIISDNASTDATEDICRRAAVGDSRIVYERQPVNRGSVWNFNYVVGRAKGTYFMRMSHDDIRAPTYISKCVALLEDNPRAVVAHSYTAAFYGDPANVLCVLTHDNLEGIRSPRCRFMRALKHLPGSAIDAVFRTDTLRTRTRLMEPVLATDMILMHELALYGEFVQAPEVLFWRSGKDILAPPQEIQGVIGAAPGRIRNKYPFIIVLLSHIKSVWRSPLTLIDRALLTAQLVGHELKIVCVKGAFRAVTAAAGDKCPRWLLRGLLALANDNPNVRILRPSRELPPVLHPTWRLLNHRNMDKALALQRKLDAKLYPSNA